MQTTPSFEPSNTTILDPNEPTSSMDWPSTSFCNLLHLVHQMLKAKQVTTTGAAMFSALVGGPAEPRVYQGPKRIIL